MASIHDRVGDLGTYLREQREYARLSIRQLADLAGVSNPYLSQIERGLRKPSAEVLQQIAKGLRISAEALYVRAGILDEEERPDVEVAISADPALTTRQKRVLLDIYASFRAENPRARGDAADGDSAGADSPGADSPGGDSPGGDSPGADSADGESPDGDAADGESPGADSPGDDSVDGDSAGAESSDGDSAHADSPGGDSPGSEPQDAPQHP